MPSSRPLLRLRLLSSVVLLATLVLALGGFFTLRHVVDEQEHKLLKQRTDEAALYLSSAIAAVPATLSTVVSGAAGGRLDSAHFAAAATPLTTGKGGFASVALVRLGATPSVVATAGQPMPGSFAGVRAAAVTRAAAAVASGSGFVGTPVFDGVGTSSRIGFAYVTRALPGYAIYAESEVHPGEPSRATAGQPFAELVASVYAGTSARPDQLIVTTGPAGGRLHGYTAHATSPVGDGAPWLVVTAARRPLVGSVATWTPGLLLAAVLIAGILTTGVVETLARRRDYAQAVADDRTAALQASLEELAHAHDQLIRQERLAAIGELASTVGHELRNPLAVISNAVYLLRNDVGPDPDDATRRHLATAEREVASATVILSDLLEFARQREPVPQPVDVGGLVDEVLAVLPPPGGITVERSAPASLVVDADRDMLRQVLVNLVSNAYQAMPDGGTVTVTAARESAGVQVSVTDTGVGMDDAVQARLFEPFFTTKARGVGLGLVVCRRIVEAHHGTLVAISSPGAGSTFLMTLPVLPRPRTSADDVIAREVHS